MPIKCDLYNPTQAARVIYDGINNSVPIRIAPGETVSGILLAEHVIATLKQSAKIGPNVDLIVTEIQDPEPEDRDAFLNQGRPVEDAATAIEATNAREEQDVDVRVNKDGSTIVNAATPRPPEPQKKTTRPPPRPRGR